MEIVVELIAALGASEAEMCAVESIGHRACGDGICLHLENDENQCYRYRDDEPLSSRVILVYWQGFLFAVFFLL